MLIKTPSGLELGGASVALTHQGKAHVMGGTVVSVSFEFQANLAPGTYFLNAGVLGVLDGIEGYLDRKIDLGVFKVRYDENMTATALVDFHISTHLYENGK
jgi:lipopolysaccharide transport system ATP-binding protein